MFTVAERWKKWAKVSTKLVSEGKRCLRWSAQAESVELGARRTGVNGRRECLCPGGAIQQANSIKNIVKSLWEFDIRLRLQWTRHGGVGKVQQARAVLLL